MTTFTICCAAQADILNQVTMQPGYEPEVIQTYATRQNAERLCATWNEEDGDAWLYWVCEARRPVTVWA